jgi:hypothetical protein
MKPEDTAMSRIDLELHGPIRPRQIGSLLSRFGRRVARNALTAAAGIAVLAAVETEPSLSGRWRYEGSGRIVTAHHMGTGLQIAAGDFVLHDMRWRAGRTFEGFTALAWEVEAMNGRCFDPSDQDSRMEVSSDFRTLVVFWEFIRADQNTCVVRERAERTFPLTRLDS